MNRDLKTLNEVVQHLTAISDMVETFRRRASRNGASDNLYKAQEHLVSAINLFKTGKEKMEKTLNDKNQGEDNGESKDRTK